MPTPSLERCCTYKIKEHTSSEVLGVAPVPPPYVIRWGDNDSADQRWVMVPEDAGTCRIINCANGEYMAIGDDGYLVRGSMAMKSGNDSALSINRAIGGIFKPATAAMPPLFFPGGRG